MRESEELECLCEKFSGTQLGFATLTGERLKPTVKYYLSLLFEAVGK